MAEHDLVIRGGMVVDGTGMPRVKGDVGIKDGRISRIGGTIPTNGATEIDASDCVVAPGAIDIHTHYDAQLYWDPYATLSGWHGVTSIVMSQCGFGFAPTRPSDQDLAMRMMERIEAIPLEAMQIGLPWDWESFPEYLDSLDRLNLGVNAAALVPFSPLRGYVLGMYPARERTSVTDAELNQMKELMYEGIKAGGFGFALSQSKEDRPEDGGFLPSHVASTEEFIGLAEVLREFPVAHMGATQGYMEEEKVHSRNMLVDMMRVSGKPLHVLDGEAGPRPCDATADSFEKWAKECHDEGLPLFIQTLCNPDFTDRFKLSIYNRFDYMANWADPFVGSPEERAVKLRDPEIRAKMKDDLDKYPPTRTTWEWIHVEETVHPENRKYEGKNIAEVAAQMKKHPMDAFLDLSLDEDLETEFHLVYPRPTYEEAKALSSRFNDPYRHISVSDGGAHVRYLAYSTWPVWWLTYWIRDMEIMSLEAGHRKMSALPAWIAGFKGRGTLLPGNWADIMVYNQRELGFLHGPTAYANDFPGGVRRLMQQPTGMRYILVNGQITFQDNQCTGATPGKLLRSQNQN